MNDLIGELYEELRGYLVTLIRNRLFSGCPEDYVYDCINDVFEIALIKQSDPNFQKNPRGWLIVTAKNVADNFNRKTINRLSYHQLDYELEWIPSKKNMLEDLAYKFAIKENVVAKVKDSLSEEDRQLFIMHFEQYMTYHEIAEELHVSISAAATRLTRVKHRVTRLIYHYVG